MLLIGSALGRHEPSAHRASRQSSLRLEELEPRRLLSVFTPAQIRHAYGFDQITFQASGQTYQGNGSGQTIAIVDAYDDPNILSDLRYFDRTFGLPDPVFTKATPQGMPRADAGWAGEIALDVEWAHAIAPKAKILLVEAKSDNLGDLLAAVDYARAQPGVVAVSMSWGTNEFSGETYYDNHFLPPAGHLGGSSGLPGASNLPGGITFVASAGDSGAWYGAEWPAVVPGVVSVGGTSLTLSSTGNYASETAWSDGGGGYSDYEREPAFQYGVQASGWRTNPDVAFNADPNTGVFVYDSYNGGWFAVGGTSAGAPQWAGLIAIADQGRALAGKGSLYSSSQSLTALYKMAGTSYASYFHDITSGSNGYSARTGYDLVTGLGTPRANAIVRALTTVSGSAGSLTFTATTSTATVTAASALVSRHLTAMPTTAPELVFSDLTRSEADVRSPSVQTETDRGKGQRAASAVFAPVERAMARFIVVPATAARFVTAEHSHPAGPAEGSLDNRARHVASSSDEYRWPSASSNEAPGANDREAKDSAEPPIPPFLSADDDASPPCEWPDACDACFADESWSAHTDPPQTVPATKGKEPGVALGPVALAGLAMVLGGYWPSLLTRLHSGTKSNRFPRVSLAECRAGT
ncbi:MAG TPA: S53 family peptidase [Gemmataceae bacterium]|nr:S53 family peptidase [Gemmataceae bacterium]